VSNTPPKTALRGDKMTEPLSPETLAWLRQTAKFDGGVTAQVLLHLLERVEAFEAAQQRQFLVHLNTPLTETDRKGHSLPSAELEHEEADQ